MSEIEGEEGEIENKKKNCAEKRKQRVWNKCKRKFLFQFARYCFGFDFFWYCGLRVTRFRAETSGSQR